jgi:hypothetical protein
MADSDSGVAVYWDFENVHACLMDELKGKGAYHDSGFQQQEPLVSIDPVVEYAATFGRIVVYRAYCNWQYYAATVLSCRLTRWTWCSSFR